MRPSLGPPRSKKGSVHCGLPTATQPQGRPGPRRARKPWLTPLKLTRALGGQPRTQPQLYCFSGRKVFQAQCRFGGLPVCKSEGLNFADQGRAHPWASGHWAGQRTEAVIEQIRATCQVASKGIPQPCLVETETPISQIRKLSFREIKTHNRDHPAAKRQSWGLNPRPTTHCVCPHLAHAQRKPDPLDLPAGSQGLRPAWSAGPGQGGGGGCRSPRWAQPASP